MSSGGSDGFSDFRAKPEPEPDFLSGAMGSSIKNTMSKLPTRIVSSSSRVRCFTSVPLTSIPSFPAAVSSNAEPFQLMRPCSDATPSSSMMTSLVMCRPNKVGCDLERFCTRTLPLAS